jgi:hypothetical protein
MKPHFWMKAGPFRYDVRLILPMPCDLIDLLPISLTFSSPPLFGLYRRTSRPPSYDVALVHSTRFPFSFGLVLFLVTS